MNLVPKELARHAKALVWKFLNQTRGQTLEALNSKLPGTFVLTGSSPRVSPNNGLLMIGVGGRAGIAAIEWTIPAEYIVETHGHAVSLYDSNYAKIAEVFVSSSAASVIKKDPVNNIVTILSAEDSRRISLHVRDEAFKLRERGITAPSSRWAQWHDGERSVTYLLEEPLTYEGRSQLIVVFSAIGAEFDFTYNYRSALSEVDAYRLYVLDDYGTLGSYYYSDHRDESIYRAIQNFLHEISVALGVDVSAITFAGSSKGGTAALIHGLPMSVGRIVVGAPQYKPGAYLRANAPAMLQFIAGDATVSSQIWLDEIVGRVLEGRTSKSQVRILVGAADHHYKRHVKPLSTELLRRGVAVQTLVVNGVSHQEIGRPFSAYLSCVAKSPSSSLESPPMDALIPYVLSWKTGEPGVAVLRLWIPLGESAAIKGFSRGHLVASRAYSETETYSVQIEGSGPIRFRVYRRSTSTGRRAGAFTTRWLRRPSVPVSDQK